MEGEGTVESGTSLVTRNDTNWGTFKNHNEQSTFSLAKWNMSCRQKADVKDSEPQYPPFNANAQSTVDVFGGHSLSGGIRCNGYPHVLQEVQLSNMTLPPHLSSTLWLGVEQVPGNDIEWVNNTFWEMRSRGRWLAQQGLDAATIMGDTCPTLSPFSPSPGGEEIVKFWTVSRWAARFVDKFPHISHADRLACWIVMFVTFQVRRQSRDNFQSRYTDNTQWQICLNSETYCTIPDWYKPLPAQNFVPHMACLDILIWYVIAMPLLVLFLHQ
jgi:hypothetical protein